MLFYFFVLLRYDYTFPSAKVKPVESIKKKSSDVQAAKICKMKKITNIEIKPIQRFTSVPQKLMFTSNSGRYVDNSKHCPVVPQYQESFSNVMNQTFYKL